MLGMVWPKRRRRLHARMRGMDDAVRRDARKSPVLARDSPFGIEETPFTASDPATPAVALWHMAEHRPELRRWIVANTAAPAALINAIAHHGGPGVAQALSLLHESLHEPGASTWKRSRRRRAPPPRHIR